MGQWVTRPLAGEYGAAGVSVATSSHAWCSQALETAHHPLSGTIGRFLPAEPSGRLMGSAPLSEDAGLPRHAFDPSATMRARSTRSTPEGPPWR
ncbi:hypothetical protein HPB50_027207 [Hyalomma asiaticum]|uniref:Uncharacterized protein n=1 Tax=Hyalomma asiaticum TaxID=266040 RepID=A0ACB7TS23_HYAAI|nr:hypothetical protein HPB50_027207 [Hyalomma asiaticum]